MGLVKTAQLATVVTIVCSASTAFVVATVHAKDPDKRFVLIVNHVPHTQPPKCDHDINAAGAVTLSKKDKDEVLWTAINVCDVSQSVLICVYLDGALNNPLDKCKSATNAEIETPFNVPAKGGEVIMTCTAKGDAAERMDYKKKLFVGAEVPSDLKCPKTLPSPSPPISRMHILDLDVRK